MTWQGDEAGVHQDYPWSSRGCRIEAVRVSVNSAGEDAFGLGTVVCACNHMSTYALVFREEPVRFRSPTPDDGDMMIVTAGHTLKFPVRAVATTGKGVHKIALSKLQVSPGSLSFVAAALAPSNSSSHLQLQQDSSMLVVNANVSWTPMVEGSFSLSLGLIADGEPIETRRWRVRVLFCEHYVRKGESLQSIANSFGTSWQALFSINPSLQQASDISVQMNVRYGRLWSCDPPLHVAGGSVHYQTEAEEVEELFDHKCTIIGGDREPLGDTVLRVGQVVGPFDQSNQNVAHLVQDVGGSLKQTLAMNPSRIHLVSKSPLIADMIHSYGDGRICLVSSLSKECPALPY